MHALLLTALTLGGVAAQISDDSAAPRPAVQPAGYQPGSPLPAPTGDYNGGYGDGQMGGCDECNGGGHGRGHGHGNRHAAGGSCFGPMPQSCYNPSFGCYPSTRFMHRYPAYHGTYYRRPYNYRNVFDYPWHAELHEPTSHFSYNVPPNPNQRRPGAPAPEMLPPVPAAAQNMQNQLRAAMNTSPAAAEVPQAASGQRMLRR